MSTPLEGILIERIREQGPMPFAAYMRFALYDARFGYYAAGAERTGWRGDFVTSPELDPAYGHLWAQAFSSIWESCGRPGRFDVVEIGPGEGTFATAVLEAATGPFGSALRYTLVERVPEVEARQRARLGDGERALWVPSVVDLVPFEHGVVFANEVLDNLPVHLMEMRDGALKEVCVTAGAGGLTFELRPPSNPELERFVGRTGVELPEGTRFEVSLAAESFIARATSAVGRGAIVFVDYGKEAERLAAMPNGSLACYSAAGVDDRPLERPGEKDITVHANWTTVRGSLRSAGFDPLGPIAQSRVLRALGASSLDDHLKAQHQNALAERRGAAAVALLSRRGALATLLDPNGLGGLEVLGGVKKLAVPAFLTAGSGA